MRVVVAAVSMLCLSACTMISGPQGIKNISAQGVINPEKSFYVPTGPDGVRRSFPTLEKKPAAGSGQEAAAVVLENLLRYQSRSVAGTRVETEEEALATARSKGLDYVLYSKVSEWTDPNYLTCTYNFVDQADVDISVYEVSSGKALKIDRLYSAGCPTRVLSIPFGPNSPAKRLGTIVDAWLGENLREKR